MNLSKSLLAGLLIATSPPVLAAPIIYFGENLSPGGAVSGAPLTARDDFLSALGAASTEDFESRAVGDASVPLVFTGSAGAVNGTITGTGGASVGVSSNAGNFATSGTKLYDAFGQTITVSFNKAISALGFYGTDISDINNSRLIITLDVGLFSERQFTVPNTVGRNNGSLLFWGITDAENPFTTISFAPTSVDGYAIDDLTIGEARMAMGGIPEPATWTMMIFGFGAVGGTLRKTNGRQRRGYLPA
jgi:hypothetical protein